ncbi:twin-arginine translocation signal domain-containing protein [Emcibacteraceae bacterium]|nr:twin-arginine translocation signal domain-containing protein [Emcibacteraceae bacterium]
MNEKLKLDRRNLLKATAATAIGGAVGLNSTASLAQSKRTVNFDEPYNRIGVNSIKWDSAIRRYGKDKIVMKRAKIYRK